MDDDRTVSIRTVGCVPENELGEVSLRALAMQGKEEPSKQIKLDHATLRYTACVTCVSSPCNTMCNTTQDDRHSPVFARGERGHARSRLNLTVERVHADLLKTHTFHPS